jgi:hypothetical protein
MAAVLGRWLHDDQRGIIRALACRRFDDTIRIPQILAPARLEPGDSPRNPAIELRIRAASAAGH